jgi:ketosteroid isomerase-like protein
MKTFAEFLPRFEQGIERFLNGDATLWKSNVSHDIDGTIMGAWVGQKEPAAMSLRVTHLFRKEQGGWKLLHRHADPLLSKTAPADVLSA